MFVFVFISLFLFYCLFSVIFLFKKTSKPFFLLTLPYIFYSHFMSPRIPPPTEQTDLLGCAWTWVKLRRLLFWEVGFPYFQVTQGSPPLPGGRVCWCWGVSLSQGLLRCLFCFLEMVSFFHSFIFSDYCWNVEAVLIFVAVP